MKPKQVVTALSALAHNHRLAIYRMLVEKGLQGLAAGEIATRLGMPSSSLTFHLQHMLHGRPRSHSICNTCCMLVWSAKGASAGSSSMPPITRS
jgi:hypothetical protein